MSRPESHNQFVRSRCKAKIYDLLDLNYLQKTSDHRPTLSNYQEQTNKFRQTTNKFNNKTTKNEQSVSKVLKNSNKPKQRTGNDLDSFEVIISSPIYGTISRQHAELKA